jgi:hypothetical protein
MVSLMSSTPAQHSRDPISARMARRHHQDQGPVLDLYPASKTKQVRREGFLFLHLSFGVMVTSLVLVDLDLF